MPRVWLIASEAILLVLLIVLPAAINPVGSLAVEPLKTSVLRAAAALLAATWLGYRLTSGSKVDVARHPVIRAGLAVLGLAIVSTALSIEPVLSFFGSFDRGMGWLTLAAGVVLLVSSADLLADGRRRERAITAILVGSIVPCAYMLGQIAGFDPINWAARGAPGSTFGSPTFLGGYLVLVAPFGLYRVVDYARAGLNGGRAFAYAATLGLLLIICTMVLQTTIRAPLLGLIVGIVCFAILSTRGLRVGHAEIAAALALLVLTGTLAIAANRATGLASLQRFLTIGGAIDSSSQRLTVWNDSIRAPLTGPLRILVGYGDETQSAVFEQREATIRQTPVELWDRAHNLLLDTWLTYGLLGVIALVWVVGEAARSAWAARAAGTLVAAAVLASLAGHLVEVSFAFHSVATNALFWVVLGMAASLTPRWRDTPGAPRPRLTLIALAAAPLLVPLLATPAIADALYGAARRSNLEIGARLEEQAASLAPWVEELPRAAGLDWQQVANRRNDAAARIRAEQDLLEAARRASLAPLPQVRLMRLYVMRGEYTAAEAACQRALVAGPYRSAVWASCAEVSAGRGLADESAARRARADALLHAPM